LAAIYLSHRPSTATHTFGYHRAEVLGALFSIFLIWGLTLLLIIEAYERVKHPIDVDGKTMSIVAGLGVFVNIVYVSDRTLLFLPFFSMDASSNSLLFLPLTQTV
jgi:zinc transporter 2